MVTVNNIDATPGCYIEGSWGQYGIDRLADICDGFGIELADKDRPGHWRELVETDDGIDGETAGRYWDLHYEAGTTLEDVLNNATEDGYWTWEDGEFFLVSTKAICIHCERAIELDLDDGWVDPLADGDDVIWRETCDAHDTFQAEHEPEEQ